MADAITDEGTNRLLPVIAGQPALPSEVDAALAGWCRRRRRQRDPAPRICFRRGKSKYFVGDQSNLAFAAFTSAASAVDPPTSGCIRRMRRLCAAHISSGVAPSFSPSIRRASARSDARRSIFGEVRADVRPFISLDGLGLSSRRQDGKKVSRKRAKSSREGVSSSGIAAPRSNKESRDKFSSRFPLRGPAMTRPPTGSPRALQCSSIRGLLIVVVLCVNRFCLGLLRRCDRRWRLALRHAAKPIDDPIKTISTAAPSIPAAASAMASQKVMRPTTKAP